jgi:hypothetical protein
MHRDPTGSGRTAPRNGAFYYTSVSAESVEIGFVDDTGLAHWMAGGPAEGSNRRNGLHTSEIRGKLGVPDGCGLQSFLAFENA